MCRLHSIILLLAISLSVAAQEDSLGLDIKTSALLNNFISIQMGIERTLDYNKFVEFEAAYIPKQLGSAELYKSDYRLKLGYKYRYDHNFLVSLTLYIRKTFHQHIEIVIRQNMFNQELEFRKTKTMIGPALGLGILSI